MNGLHITALFLISWVLVDSSHHRRGPFRQQFFTEELPVVFNGVDPGKPLFLTPYIERGELDKAKQLSLVGPLKGYSRKSYSGFLTVNKNYDSNMFFWFFPALTNAATAPVVLWLQGGPGGSSMFGLFVENGPIELDQNIQLHPRNITWNSKYSMLYIDNPVGTGFSFTNSTAGYAKNETDVARDLYSALTQFFTVFHEYQTNEFYATGESYAGKYVPAITYKILQENPTAKTKINLKGMAIGDGLCDPVTMLDYGDFLYQIGLSTASQTRQIKAETSKIVDLINNKRFKDAFYTVNKVYDYIQQNTGISDYYNYLRTVAFDDLLNGDTIPYPSYFTNITGITNYYNYLMTKEPPAFERYNKYFSLSDIRRSIHVGSLTYNAGSKVEQALINDVMNSVKPWITAIMNTDLKVMIYSGQLDIIIAYPLTESFLNSIPWKGRQQYLSAKRTIWRLTPSDPEVAGYARQVNNFYQVLVRGGGHILPFDQPARSFDMIDRFISGRGFA